MKFLEAVEVIRGTENIIKKSLHNKDYYEFRDNVFTHVTYFKNGMEFPMCATIESSMLEANDWTIIKKENLAEQKLETKMDTLLSALFDYANDGDAGPGSPLLPTRDVRLRKIISKLQRNL